MAVISNEGQGAPSEGELSNAATREITNSYDAGRVIPLSDLEGTSAEDAVAPDAVATGDIQNGAVTEPKLADGAVTEPKLADGAVTTDKIDGQAVETGKLADEAVTGAKIAAPGGWKSGSFAGSNGPGACSLPGAVAFDRVLAIARVDAAGGTGTRDSFESVISVPDQIQQSDVADLSLQTFMVLLLPGFGPI